MAHHLHHAGGEFRLQAIRVQHGWLRLHPSTRPDGPHGGIPTGLFLVIVIVLDDHAFHVETPWSQIDSAGLAVSPFLLVTVVAVVVRRRVGQCGRGAVHGRERHVQAMREGREGHDLGPEGCRQIVRLALVRQQNVVQSVLQFRRVLLPSRGMVNDGMNHGRQHLTGVVMFIIIIIMVPVFILRQLH